DTDTERTPFRLGTIRETGAKTSDSHGLPQDATPLTTYWGLWSEGDSPSRTILAQSVPTVNAIWSEPSSSLLTDTSEDGFVFGSQFGRRRRRGNDDNAHPSGWL